jgi:DNA replication protein DnaC
MTAPVRPPDLVEGLKALHLPTMRSGYASVAEQARQESLSYEHYLLELVQQEWATRREHRIARFLRDSHLPLEKTLATLDRKRLSAKLQAQLNVLLEGTFLDQAENVLAFGTPGSGKTHLLCAVGQELIYQQERRLRFMTGSELIQQLLVAKRDLELPRLLKRWDKYQAIILDDIGYVQHSREEMEVFFTLLAHRYERGSLMITSNLPFSQWETLFKDPMTTAAAIDRLVHHCLILEMNLPSYRLEASKQRSKQAHPSGGSSEAPETAAP